MRFMVSILISALLFILLLSVFGRIVDGFSPPDLTENTYQKAQNSETTPKEPIQDLDDFLDSVPHPPNLPKTTIDYGMKTKLDGFHLPPRIPSFPALPLQRPLTSTGSHYRDIPPKFPATAQRSGHCVVDIKVKPDGHVQDISYIKCSESIFEKPSRDNVKKWIFRPLIRNGKPVEFETRETIRYNLMDENGNLIPE